MSTERFDVPYGPSDNLRSATALSPDGRVAYALSNATLFIFDPSDATLLGTVDLRLLLQLPTGRNELDFAYLGASTPPRLLVWNQYDATSWSLTFDDPMKPRLERTYDRAHSIIGGLPLPDGRTLALASAEGTELLDLSTGLPAMTLANNSGYPRIFATGGSAANPLVVTADSAPAWPYPASVAIFDARDPYAPSLRSQFSFSGRPTRVELSPRGDLVLLSYQLYDPKYARYELYDAADGTLLSAFGQSGLGAKHAFVEAEGERVLVTVDPRGLNVIDLSDPTAPTDRGRIQAAIAAPYPYATVSDDAIFGSATQARAFVVAIGDRALLTIDVRTATTAGRFEFGGDTPDGLTVQEGVDGARAALVPAWLGDFSAEHGGIAAISSLDLANPDQPRLASRFFRPGIERPDSVGAIGGRLGLAFDSIQNTLALYRLSDGAILDTASGVRDWYAPMLVADPYVGIFGSRAWTVYRVEGEHLVHVSAGPAMSELTWSARLGHDGTVILGGVGVHRESVETYLADGRSGWLRIRAPYPELKLSADGRRLLVGQLYPSEFQVTSTMVDLSDPANPRVVWDAIPGLESVAFAQSDERLVGCWSPGYSTNVLGMFDAATGAPLGASSDPLTGYWSHIELTSGVGARARAIVSHDRSYDGRETLLFDISGNTPHLLAALPPRPSWQQPPYVARGDGGWYEMYSGSTDDVVATDILAADADGRQYVGAHTEDSAAYALGAVRPGFLISGINEPSVGFGVALWRDTELNRPPVARAGDDRAVECSGASGTAVHVDGTASTDPDSTPGTNDDIASYAWSIGDDPAPEGAEADLTLGLGAHHATMTVTDVLGATGIDSVEITVADTRPPAVALTLSPVIAGGVWANLFAPQGIAADLCEGDLGPPAERLRLPVGASAAPASWVNGSATTIELRRRPSGDLEVNLIGPDPAALRATWSAAVASGGFALDDGLAVGLILAPEGRGRDASLVARYGLNGDGRLARATAYGSGDHVVDASAADSSGHSASTSVSLRAALAGFCGQTPESVACAGGVAKRAPSAQMSTRRRPVPAQ